LQRKTTSTTTQDDNQHPDSTTTGPTGKIQQTRQLGTTINNITMLSNPTSAIETRRRSQRPPNATPKTEGGKLRRGPTSAMSGPASGGIQRTNSHRVGGHRRGLSLDQPRLITSSKMTPTLGSISQDDISVSNTNNSNGGMSPNPGQFQHNNRNTVVAQASLAQPGQGHIQGNHFSDGQFHHPAVYSSPLALQAIQQFEANAAAAAMMSHSHHQHHHSLSHPHSPVGFAGLNSPHASPNQHPNPFTPGAMPHAPLTSGPQFQSMPPTMQQIEDLNKHIKSVYGMMGEVHINILPTPVATPQKRPGPIPNGNDVGNMGMKFDSNQELTLDPSLVGNVAGDFKLHNMGSPASERDYASSFYNSSPSHSVSCSPQQQNIKSFLDIAQATNPLVFSSQTSLVDVEPMMGDTHGSNSPDRMSPRPVSIADLSIDGTIEDTGISEAEIQQYISQQDLSNHRWTCLYPGCDAKTFGRRENIRSHVQTHLGDRQFRCNHCGKCFVRQHDLKRHSKIHSGNKPYKCPCGGGFARQDALTRHRQRGMCVGGFPNAVRKQARRGRPKKVRSDDFGERLEKELESRQRDRANSLSNSDIGSEGEDSPSPRGYGDSARLMDLPEEDEIDTFGYALPLTQDLY
jgi:regulatory protein SWI5